MNKAFFDSLGERQKAFAKRAGVKDASVEVGYHSGRTVLLDEVVEAGDEFVQIDGHYLDDEGTRISIVTAYHQIGTVSFIPQRERIGRAGF